MSNYDNIEALPLTPEDMEQMDPDNPVIAARRESIAANSANIVTLRLPYGVMASLVGPLIRHMLEGAQGVQQAEAISALMRLGGEDAVGVEGGTMGDLKELLANVEDDKGIVRLARTALGAIANAEGVGDRFFPVDMGSTLERIDADFPGYNVPLPQVLEDLSPERVNARIAKQDAKARAKVAAANDAVADELAKFATNTDRGGAALN